MELDPDDLARSVRRHARQLVRRGWRWSPSDLPEPAELPGPPAEPVGPLEVRLQSDLWKSDC